MGGFVLRNAAFVFAAALCAAAPSPALAQAHAIVVGQSQPKNVLQRGTEVALETVREINSNDAKVGDRFDLEVRDDVKLNGRTVIPAGTRAVGEVTVAKKKGMWGKSGKLETRLLYIEF